LNNPSRPIDDLANEASEHDLVSQLTSDRETRVRHELLASEIRKRISTLKARLTKLAHDHPQKTASR
jgi:hypothetical protein